jgi:hypothetical protein
MAGLRKILKSCGKMTVTGSNGLKVEWTWDYAKDEPRMEHEMTRDEKNESEKAKFKLIAAAIEKFKTK